MSKYTNKGGNENFLFILYKSEVFPSYSPPFILINKHVLQLLSCKFESTVVTGYAIIEWIDWKIITNQAYRGRKTVIYWVL